MPTPEQIHRQGIEERDGRRCRLAKLGGCRGRVQADHILKVSALRRHRSDLPIRRWRSTLSDGQLRFIDTPLEQLIADSRNGWMLCADGHHAPKDRGEIPPEILIDRWPVEMLAFIDDFDLGNLIAIEFGSGAVARLHGHGRPTGDAFAGWID